MSEEEVALPLPSEEEENDRRSLKGDAASPGAGASGEAAVLRVSMSRRDGCSR